MTMNCDYAADCLFETAALLKTYESAELQSHAKMLIYIAAEVRKFAPPSTLVERLNRLKAEPPRSDPNSKLPRPVTPPRGGLPHALAIGAIEEGASA
jgi:hypothetical protein